MDSRISYLIMGFLNQSLEKSEREEFYHWVNENPENKQLFFELKSIYDACSHQGKSIDINESWQRLLDKKRSNRSPVIPLWRRIGAYAAVAVAAVLLTSVFFTYYRSGTEPSVARYIGGNGIEADAIILPDGTRVNVGTKTTFACDADYGKNKRIVYLEGEAYFDVAKQKSKPFIVKVKGQDIEALGTKFNVKAYSSDSLCTTTLLEGAVALTDESNGKRTILQPDQQYVYNRNRQTFAVNPVDASQFTSWVDGYFYFPNQSLQTILDKMGDVYGFKFEIASEKLKSKKFTGTFYKGQRVRDVLEIINISISIKYEIKEQHVMIREE